MLKKLFTILLLAVATSAMAAEKITLVWGFSPAANQANFYRALAREINAKQDKYEIVVDTKPGAGGAVGANYTLQNAQNTIFGGTSTFFIRPNFNKETGYSADSFKPVFVQTLGAPLVLLSKKHQSVADLKKQKEVTVSISGVGSSSHLMATEMGESFSGVRIVNYPSLIDANKDILGQHIDSGWNFLADVEGLLETGDAYAIGITGTRGVKNYKTFGSQGVKGFDALASNTAIFAGTAMPDTKVAELYALFREANKSEEVRALYAKEYSTPADFTQAQTKKWYDEQVKFWAQQSSKVKPLQ
jgi:tripartite-type tricarboxylate transporter receptor subunit TctC